ncbi:nitrate reductase [Xaviernesmea oryzae]|uniref:Nitrate reductase n=1 Tax=Xaviernesmea oryzae TaxID=464029 RepID=A0A1Q9AXX1_9HYPH|nr:nitrate reductase [Xaviernesmea oryzae]OLP60270.1 nitrate reductase [Xaviernesmea oryzae]SEK25531.1 assimilatory nitrate reductase catalytic subunit [Xaviernesmea oryzae]
MAVETKTTCPYCGTGCGVIARREADGRVSVKGDPDHPANFGRLCSKGSALGETVDLDDRLLHPEIGGRRASWDDALDLVADRFRTAIAEHGPDAVAFYVSGQCLTEDYYVANKLMKGFIGSANIDTNSRLCMSSSVAGHRRAFGADTVPGTYEDLELADLVVLTGSNLAWCHPVLFQRLAAAKAARPEMKVVVIDPRRTMTAEIADLHLSIRADGDVALFLGLLRHLAAHDALDRTYIAAHTRGFHAALAEALALDDAELQALTGLTASETDAFFRLFADTEKVVTCYSQGVNQSSAGTDKVNAILNCHLATGRIGRPGMGPFSLTGQPNAMGGREVGGLANMLAAHMALENPEDRDRVQRFWKAPVIADHAGLKAVDLFRAAADGKIKALWIMATNPVVSLPEADLVRQALRTCPFTVVSDMSGSTDTAREADVLLPALGWGEKDGTVTNSERRISRQRAFLPAPGEAQADWWQIAEVARRLGYGEAFPYQSPAEIFAEHAALSAFENEGARDFDIGAWSRRGGDDYQAMTPFQWPQRQDGSTQARFFADGRFYHADGKARFVAVSPSVVERRTADFPLILNSGRIRDHWHTMTRTGKSARLSSHIAEPFCEIHPRDAAALGIEDAALVAVESPLGRVILRALVTPRQAEGALFAPMHWNDGFAAEARIGALIPGLTDPHSGQPASKNVAVRARPFKASAYGFAVLREKPVGLDCAYWALGKAEHGWRLEFALDEAPEDWTGWCRDRLGLDPACEPIGYLDATSGDVRLAFFAGERLLAAVYLAREPVAVARSFALAQLGLAHGDMKTRLAVIAGRPDAGRADPGATVCACLSVGVNQITAAIRAGADSVEAIGACLNAGTNCGSCRSEIKGILHACHAAAAE